MEELFTSRKEGNSMVITASMTLSHLEADQFSREIQKLDFTGVSTVYMDLSECTYISSKVLGAFIAVRQKLTEQGITVRLSNVPSTIQEVLDASGVTELFNGNDQK